MGRFVFVSMMLNYWFVRFGIKCHLALSSPFVISICKLLARVMIDIHS